MSETKFLKAHCSSTDRYFGLEIKKIGSAWKVVNMIDLPREEAKLISSEVEQPFFETHTTLIACTKCGNRKVGSCACSPRLHSCSADMKYKFDCIYCNKLSVDYSLPTADEVGSMAGGSVKLSQGQEVKIRLADNRPLKKIEVGVGWDPAPGATNMDVDSSVAVYSPNSSTHELIYFGNKVHPTNCVVHHGDNLTGADSGSQGDDENITVNLDRVPQDRDRLVFVLNIYKADERGQSLDKVRNLYIKLYDPDSRTSLIEYHVNNQSTRDNSIVIGVAIRRGSGWSFKAVGKTLHTDSVSDLGARCISLI